MAIGLVGRKCGMTRVFTEDGVSIPVTVIEALPNRVTRVRSTDSDGYVGLQVTTGSKKPSRVSKPDAGQFASVGAEIGEGLWEFRAEDAAVVIPNLLSSCFVEAYTDEKPASRFSFPVWGRMFAWRVF